MKRSHALTVSCGVLAGVVAAAHADQVFVEIQGTDIGRGVAVTLSGGLKFWDGSTSKSVWAGQRALTLDGALVRAYSAELISRQGSGWYDETGADETLGDLKAAAINSLFVCTKAGDVSSRDEAAALQAVLWEIIYDYDGTSESLDVKSGKVQVGMVNTNLFANLKAMALSGGDCNMVEIVTSDTFGDHFRIVPLPSAAGLAGLGLLTLGAAARRRA